MKNQLKEYKIVPTEKSFEIAKKQITNSIDAFEYIKQFWNEDIEVYESVFILLLNRSNKPIGWAKISQGGITSSVIETKIDRKSTRLNSSHMSESRMPSSA